MSRSKSFIVKLLYATGANLLSLIVSLLTILLIPKFFGADIEQYGYFKIYLFYFSYIGFFHFGLCDGIYLRDGGKNYSELDRPLCSSQFLLLSASQLIIALAVSVIGLFFAENAEYRFIFITMAINILIVIPRTMLSYFLQATNRIKEYSWVTALERVVFGLSMVAVFLIGIRNYKLFIWADIFGKALSLILAVAFCRDIVFSKAASFRAGLFEALTNISVGIKLLFANMASMLITGIVSWGIQMQWSVETYGKISFTLSVSNFILTFISAVALVLYPALRRKEGSELLGIYTKLRDGLMLPLLGCLILYYPMELVLSAWLPQYAESMRYMAILFPVCIYATKMTMLIGTYMNVLRLEKKILRVNLVGVAVAALTTAVSVFWLKSLTLAMVSIVINQMFRCIYAELCLAKTVKLSAVKDIVLEGALTAVFIAASWFVGGWFGVLIYALAFAGYAVIKRRAAVGLLSDAKKLIKK